MVLGKELMRGSLDMLVLSALANEPLYGYRILKKIRQAGDGLVQIHAGAMYPILHRLEVAEAIESWWDKSVGRPRKWYKITEKGQRLLAEQANQWQHYVSCIRKQLKPALDQLGDKHSAQPSPA